MIPLEERLVLTLAVTHVIVVVPMNAPVVPKTIQARMPQQLNAARAVITSVPVRVVLRPLIMVLPPDMTITANGVEIIALTVAPPVQDHLLVLGMKKKYLQVLPNAERATNALTIRTVMQQISLAPADGAILPILAANAPPAAIHALTLLT